MSFQTRKIFVHIQNTNLDFFLISLRAFWTCIDSKATITSEALKGSMDIGKIVHVTSVVQDERVLRVWNGMRVSN